MLRDVKHGVGTVGGFGGVFAGGANFLFADGRVRFISKNIDPGVLRALATHAGNEIIDPRSDFNRPTRKAVAGG
ncbi:MAG: H-X9-DG-CTERM domain-containing protein [bacterium]